MTRPIKVLRIINRFNLGGPTFNVAYLTKYMSDRFETKLIGGMKDESEASSDFILNSVGLTPEYIPNMKRSISFKNDVIAYKYIKQIIDDFKPDIVHTHASKAGTLGRLAAKNANVPVIVHTFHGHVFHSYFGKAQTLFYKIIERYLARKSTKIVAISEIQKKELSEIHKICSPEKMEVIPLGFDLNRFIENQDEKRIKFRNQFGLKADDVVVSIIGRLVPIKNHRMFLESIKALPDEVSAKAKFLIVGDGESKEELLAIAQNLGLKYVWAEHVKPDSNLCFTSWIKEVDEVIAGSDIICLSSLNEGTPVSLIEAQAGARAVISTRVGGIEDVVLENKSALLCDVNDVLSFTNHMALLIKDNQRREDMGKFGRNHVIEKFSYQRLVNDMEKLYLQLIDQKTSE